MPPATVHEAENRLGELLARARRAGLEQRAVVALAAVRTSSKAPSNSNNAFLWGALLAGLILSYAADLLNYEGLLRAYLTHSGKDIYNEMCAVYTPDWVSSAVRPAEDCSICRNVTAVHKVSNITPEEFELRYAYTGVPVVVTDAMSEWTAPKVFGFEFFRKLYRDVSPESSGCQFFPYETEFTSLREALEMPPERAHSPWYIGWSNCDDGAARTLRRHYARPYFLPSLSENKNTDWIFMGSPGYGAKMHIDNVNNPSWQAQLVGSKLWSLEPPPECYFECRPLQVTVHQGEIIVLDTNRWYHKTLIVSEDVSVTIGAEYD